MSVLYNILEKVADVGFMFSIPLLIGFCYTKIRSIITRETYTIQDLSHNWFGEEEDHGSDLFFSMTKYCFIFGFIATIGLLFFIIDFTDIIYIALKLISITIGLICIYSNKMSVNN